MNTTNIRVKHLKILKNYLTNVRVCGIIELQRREKITTKENRERGDSSDLGSDHFPRDLEKMDRMRVDSVGLISHRWMRNHYRKKERKQNRVIQTGYPV